MPGSGAEPTPSVVRCVAAEDDGLDDGRPARVWPDQLDPVGA